MNKRIVHDALILTAFTPVSYTHLDVYKRQYGRFQSADSMVHRISGRNKCSGLMIWKTILRHL